MTTLEVLTAARKRIDTPSKWCKGYISAGSRCCIMGALDEVTLTYIEFHKAKDVLLSQVGDGIEEFNDHPTTTHRDVLALFDRAIEAERKRGMA